MYISCKESFSAPSIVCSWDFNAVRYKILSKIGEGSFSDVLKCQEFQTGKFYACKRLKKIYQSAKQIKDIPEIMALQKIGHHPNVTQLLETIYEPYPGYVIMVFELCDMSLYDLMKTKKRGLPETQVRDYIYQLLHGLEFIHKNGTFHRDIKPENILLKNFFLKGNIIKLGDLGSVQEVNCHPPYTEYVSTRWYRSPECLLTTGYYGPKMDIWAAGCVFYELLTLKPLFPGENEIDQIHLIHSIIGVPSARTMDKFRKYKSYNYEWAVSWDKPKNLLKNKSDHWGYGIFRNNPEEYSASGSLHSFPKCDHLSSFGQFKLFSMITNLSEPGKEVLKQMLVYDPDLRSSAHRVIEHRYFNLYRGNEICSRKQRFAEIPGIKCSIDRNDNKSHKVYAQQAFKVSPRKFINRPTVVEEIKELPHINCYVTNKKTSKENRPKQDSQWHLPMISAKYVEEQAINKSSCKGTSTQKINSLSSNKMVKEQVIFARKNKNIILPKITLKEEQFEKCKECNKLKLIDNHGSKCLVKPKQGHYRGKDYDGFIKSNYVKINDITVRAVKFSSPNNHRKCLYYKSNIRNQTN